MSLGPTNFKVVRGMISGELLDFLGYYAYARASSPDAKPDSQVPTAPALYNDPAMVVLLHSHLYDMKQYFGVDLKPTYAYLRIYKNGDILHKHTDRDLCEYSVSITLKREHKDEIWPLYLETDQIYKTLLEEGDALIYKGIENSHWRNKFEGERLAQLFLHYVRR